MSSFKLQINPGAAFVERPNGNSTRSKFQRALLALGMTDRPAETELQHRPWNKYQHPVQAQAPLTRNVAAFGQTPEGFVEFRPLGTAPRTQMPRVENEPVKPKSINRTHYKDCIIATAQQADGNWTASFMRADGKSLFIHGGRQAIVKTECYGAEVLAIADAQIGIDELLAA